MESKSSIRKIISNPFIQTVAMYVSGGWILIELLEYFIAHFNLNERIRIIFLIGLLGGLPVAMIITWFISRERKDSSKSLSAQKPPGKYSRIFRNPVYSLPSMVILLLLLVFGIRYLNRRTKTKWAKEEALVQIEQLLNERNVIPAFDLLKKAEKYIARDADFIRLTDIYIREYADTTQEWEWLGHTPIDSVDIPNYTLYLMLIEKPDFEAVVAAVPSNSDTVYRRLFSVDEIPEGMVYAYSGNLSEEELAPERGFYIDRYEVTNQQYKAFIEQGAYKKKDFWKHDFIKNGEQLLWQWTRSSWQEPGHQ